MEEEGQNSKEKLNQLSEETQYLREQEQLKHLELQSIYKQMSNTLEKTSAELSDSVNTIDDLKLKLTEKDNQLTSANEVIEELTKQSESDHLCVQQLKEEIRDFVSVLSSSDLEEAKIAVKSLMNEKENYKEEVTNLQGKVSELETECSDKVSDIMKQKSVVEEELENFKLSVDLLNDKLLNRQCDFEKERTDKEAIQRKLEDTLLELSQQNREISLLKEGQLKGGELETTIQALLSQLNDAENKILETNNTVQDQCKQIDELTDDLQRSSKDIETYKNEIRDLQSAYDGKDNLISEITNNNHKLEETFKELQTECHNLQTNVCERDEKIMSLTNSAEEINNCLKETQQKFFEVTSQKDIIESENIELKEELFQRHSATTNLLQKLSAESQKRLSEEEQIANLKTSNEETMQCLKSLEQETEHVKNELQSAQLELTEIKTLCSEKDTNIQNLTETVQMVTVENQTLHILSTETSEKLLTSQSALQEMTEKLRSAEEALTALQADNERLQKQVSGMQHECILKHEQLCTLQATLSQVQNENDQFELELHLLEKLALDCSGEVNSLLKHVCSLNSGIQEKILCMFSHKQSEDVLETACDETSNDFKSDSNVVSMDTNISTTEDLENVHGMPACRARLKSMSVKLNDTTRELKKLNTNTMKVFDSISDMSESAKDLESVLTSLQSENCDLRDCVQNIQYNLTEKLSEIEILKSSQIESEKLVKELSKKIQNSEVEESLSKHVLEIESTKSKEEHSVETEDSTEAAADSLPHEKQNYGLDKGELLLENQVLKCQICDLNANLKIFEEKCYLLEAEVKVVKQHWTKIQTTLSSLENSYKTAIKEKDRLQCKFDFTKEKIDLMHEERDKYKSEVQKLLEEMKALSSHNQSSNSSTEINADIVEMGRQTIDNSGKLKTVSEDNQDDLQERIKTLTNERNSLSDSILALKTELQEYRSTCNELQIQMGDLQTALDSLTLEHKQTNERSDQLQSHNCSLILKNESIVEEQKKLCDENEVNKNLIAEMKKEIGELQTKLLQLEDTNLSLKQQAMSLDCEMEKALKDKEYLEKEVIQKDSELKYTEALHRTAQNENEALSLKLSIVENDLQNALDQYDSSRSITNDLSISLRQGNKKLTELEMTKLNLQEANRKLEDTAETLRQERKLLEVTIEELKSNYVQLENESKTLTRDMSNKIVELESTNMSKNEEIKSMLDQHRQEVSEHDRKSKENELNTVSLQNKIQQLEEENKSSKFHYDEMKERNSYLEDTIAEMKKSLVDVEYVVHSKTEESTELESKLREAEELLASKCEECELVRNKQIQFKDEVETRSIQGDILLEEISDLNLNAFSLRADLHKSLKNLHMEGQERKQLQEANDAFQTEKQTLQQSIKSNSERNVELQTVNESLKTEKESLVEEIEKLIHENETQKSLILNMNVERDEFQTKEQNLEDTNCSLNLQIQSLELEVERSQASNKLLEADVAKKKSGLMEAQASSEMLQKDNDSLCLKVSLMENELQKALDECDSSKSVVSSIKCRLKEVNKQLTEIEMLNKNVKGESIKLEEVIQNLTQEKDKIQLHFEELQNDHMQLKDEIHTVTTDSSKKICDLESRVVAEIEEKDNLNHKFEHQKVEIENHIRMLKEYDDSNIALQTKLQSCESTLQALECEAGARCVQIDELTGKNQCLESTVVHLQNLLATSQSALDLQTNQMTALESKQIDLEQSFSEKCTELATLSNESREVIEAINIQSEIFEKEVFDLNLTVFSSASLLQKQMNLHKKLKVENAVLRDENNQKNSELTEKTNFVSYLQSQLEVIENNLQESSTILENKELIIKGKNDILLKLSESLNVQEYDSNELVSKVDILLNQSIEKDEKIFDYDQEVQTLLQENRDLKMVSDEIQELNTSVKNELETRKAENTILIDTNAKLMEDIDNLNGEIAEYKNRLLIADNVILDSESKITSLTSSLNDLTTMNNQLTDHQNEMESKYQCLLNDLSENQAILCSLESSLKDKEILCTDLSAKLVDANEQIACRDTEYKQLESINGQLQSDNLQLTYSLESSNKGLTSNETLLKKISQEFEDRNKDSEILQSSLQEQKDEITTLNKLKEDLQEDLDIKSGLLSDLEFKFVIAEGKFTETLGHYDVLEQRLETVESELSRLRDKLLLLLMQVYDSTKSTDDPSSPSSPFEHLSGAEEFLAQNEDYLLTELTKEYQLLISSNKDLKASCKIKTDDIDSLQLKVKESFDRGNILESRIGELQGLLNEKETELSNLANNVHELDTNLLKIKEERNLKLELLSDNVTDLVTQLDNCTHQRDELESKLNDAVSNLANTEAARNDLECKQRSIEVCLEEKSAALEVLQDQFSSLSDENGKLVKSLHKSESIISDKNVQIEELTIANQGLILEKSKLEKSENDLTILLHSEQLKLEQAETQVTSKQKDIELHMEENVRIETELNASKKKVEDLSSEVSHLESSVEKYKEDILSLETSLSDLKDNLSDVKQINKDLYMQINDREMQWQILSDQCKSLVEDNTSKAASCRRLSFDNEMFKRNVERFEERLDEAATKESELKCFVDTYSMEIEKMKDDGKQLSESLHLMKNDIETHKQTIQNEKEAHQETKQAMEKIIEEHRATVDEYETQISLVKSSYDVLLEKDLSIQSAYNHFAFKTKNREASKDTLLLENQSLYSQIENLEKQLLEQLQWVSEHKKDSEKKSKIIEEHQNLMCKATDLESSVHELKEDQKLKLSLIESLKKETAMLKSQLQDAEIKSLALVVGLETEKDALAAQLEDLHLQHSSEVAIQKNNVEGLEASVSQFALESTDMQPGSLRSDQQSQETEELFTSHVSSLTSASKELDISNIDHLTQVIDDMNSEKSTLELIKTELEDNLEITRNDCEKALSDLSNALKEVEKLSCQVRESDFRNKELYNTSVVLSQKIEEKDSDLKKVTQCLNAANLKLRESQDVTLKKDQEINILENNIFNIREECLSDKSLLSRLMVDMNGANKKFSVLIDTIVEKDTSMAEMEKQLEEMKQTLKEAEDKITCLMNEQNEAKKQQSFEVSSILSEKEKNEIILEEKNSEIIKLCSELQNSVEKLKSAEQTLTDCNKEKSSLEESLATLKIKSSSQIEEIKELKSEVALLEKCKADKDLECTALSTSLKQSGTQIEYLLQSSTCMNETLERNELESTSLKCDFQAMTENATTYENLLLEKNAQICALVEELEIYRNRLFSQISLSSKLTLQKQKLDLMLVKVQNEISNQKEENALQGQVLQDLLNENKQVSASLEQSRQALSKKTALVTKIKHDSEINFLAIKEKIEIFREDVKSFQNDYLNYTKQTALNLTSSFQNYIDSNTYTCSLQDELKDNSDTRNDDRHGVALLIKDRDALLEELNVRKTDHEALLDKYYSLEDENDKLKVVIDENNVMIAQLEKYKCLEDENNDLKAELEEHKLILTKEREDLIEKSNLIQSLEHTLQDTEYRINQNLADTENLRTSYNILEEQNLHLTKEIQRLSSNETSKLDSEQVDKEILENQSLQNEMLCAELNIAKENIISLGSLKTKHSMESEQEQTSVIDVAFEESGLKFEEEKVEHLSHDSDKENIKENIEEIRPPICNIEELENIILLKNQQILNLEQELSSLKETQVPDIEWDDYDLRNICNKLEYEKQELSAEVANQLKLLKKKEGQIKTLTRQLDSLHKEHEFDSLKQENDQHEPSDVTETLNNSSSQIYSAELDTPHLGESTIVPSINSALNTECLPVSLDTQGIGESIILPSINTALNTECLPVSPIDELQETIKMLTLERDKFKADNKKLLKVGKGKDTKLNIMNRNFEKLRQERDELLEERESIDNDLQDLKSKNSNFDSSYDKEIINNLMMRCKELEALCEEKQMELMKAKPDTQHITQSGDNYETDTGVSETELRSKLKVSGQERVTSETEVNVKPPSNLKSEITKLQKINKGKEAKIKKLEEKNSVQENEIKILKEILTQKEADIATVNEDKNAFEKMNEEKIILDFELQCAKEELAKLRHGGSLEQDKDSGSLNATENLSEGVSDTQKEDSIDIFSLTDFSSEIIQSKVVSILVESKKLKQENGKLQKLSKGKEAKVKKVEDVLSQQQKVISDKDTDILILKESVKDLTSKIESLTEEEHDLRYRLENALLDRDEWYDHCQNLEDQIEVAHESIDIKNEELLRLDETADADRETIDNLIYERDSLERDLEDLKDEIDILRSTLSKKDDEIRDFKSQIDVLQEEKEKHSSEIKKLQMVKKGKAAKAKKLEESVMVQENAMEAKEELVLSLENQKQELLSEKNSLEGENDEMKSQIMHMDNEILELKNELDILNFKVNDQNEEIKSLLEIKETLTAEIDAKNVHLVAERHIIENKEYELNQQLFQNSELEKKNNDQEQLVQQLNLLLAQKDENIIDLDNQLSSSNNALHEKHSYLVTLQDTTNSYLAQIHEKDKELVSLENRIRDLEKTSEEQKLETDESQKQLQKVCSVNQELEQLIHKKEEEVVSMSGRCEALKKQFDYNMTLIQERDNEISSLRKKYFALDEQSVLKQSMYEEQEKHMSSLSEEEIVKLQQIVQEKEETINMLKQDIQSLGSEKEKLSVIIGEKDTDFELSKHKYQEEKDKLEKNLSWYIQHHELSNANILALQEENSSFGKQLQDMSASLAESSRKYEDMEEYQSRIIREKENSINELQFQHAQVLEKLEFYECNIKEKQIVQEELQHKLESLQYQYQQLINQTEQTISEKDAIVANLQTDLKESLKSNIKMTHKEAGVQFDGSISGIVDTVQSQVADEESPVSDQKESLTKEVENQELSAEVIKLKKLCKGKDAKIKKLEEKIKKISESDGDSTTDHSHKQQEAINLKQSEEMLELQQEKQKLLSEVEILSKQVSQQQTDIENLKITQREASNNEESLKTQIKNLRIHSGTLEKDFEICRIECDQHQANLAKLQTEYTEIHHQAQVAADDFISRLNTANLEVDRLNKLVENCNKETQSAISEKEASSLQAHSKDKEIAVLKGNIQSNMIEMQVLNNKLTLLEQNNQGFISEIERSKEVQQEKLKLLNEVEILSKQVSQQQIDIENLKIAQREASNQEESLKNQIKNLQMHSDTLEKDFDMCRIERDQHQANLAKLQTEYTEIHHQAQLAANEFTSRLNTANSEVEHLNKIVSNCNKETQSAISEKEAIALQVVSKDEEIAALKGNMQSNMTEIQVLNDRLSFLEQNNQGVKSEKERFEELLKSEKEEIQSLYEQMNELVSEKLDLETSMQGKDQDLRAARETLQVMADDRKKLETVLSEKEELLLEVETLTRDIKLLRERLGQRDEENKTLEKIIQDKENDIYQVGEQLTLLTSEKDSLSGNLNKTNEDLNLLEEKADAISKELESKKEAASKLRDLLFEKDELVSSLKESVDLASSEIKTLTQQKGQLNEELSMYKQQCEHEREKCLSMETEIVNLNSKCYQLEATVTEKDNTLISKANEIGVLHRRILSLEETSSNVNPTNIVHTDLITSKDVKVLEMEAATEAVRKQENQELQEPELSSIVSIESQILRTEVLPEDKAFVETIQSRQVDQVYQNHLVYCLHIIIT